MPTSFRTLIWLSVFLLPAQALAERTERTVTGCFKFVSDTWALTKVETVGCGPYGEKDCTRSVKTGANAVRSEIRSECDEAHMLEVIYFSGPNKGIHKVSFQPWTSMEWVNGAKYRDLGPIRSSEPTPPKPAQRKPVPADPNRNVVGEIYRGMYYCAQGSTPVEISFPTNKVGAEGMFTFGGGRIPKGSFLFKLETSADESYTISPLRWVVRPANYNMVSADVTIENGELRGRINDSACGKIWADKLASQ